MMQNHEEPIRRRRDGSIDIDVYGRRAARLRSSAMRAEPARWLQTVKRWVRDRRYRIEKAIELSRQRRELMRMENDMLKDIAISRCSIEWTIRNGRECRERKSGLDPAPGAAPIERRSTTSEVIP